MSSPACFRRDINLPFITAGRDSPKHLDMTLTRAKFDELTADLVEMTVEPTRKVLWGRGRDRFRPSKIILFGGSTRNPRRFRIK
jgi:molecular chaperone DnaK